MRHIREGRDDSRSENIKSTPRKFAMKFLARLTDLALHRLYAYVLKKLLGPFLENELILDVSMDGLGMVGMMVE